jgi:hypothetical protein
MLRKSKIEKKAKKEYSYQHVMRWRYRHRLPGPVE